MNVRICTRQDLRLAHLGAGRVTDGRSKSQRGMHIFSISSLFDVLITQRGGSRRIIYFSEMHDNKQQRWSLRKWDRQVSALPMHRARHRRGGILRWLDSPPTELNCNTDNTTLAAP